jgi:hypothetical protein
MAMQKAKTGSQSVRVDEGNHRVEVVEPVFERRAGQNERKPRSHADTREA